MEVGVRDRIWVSAGEKTYVHSYIGIAVCAGVKR